MCEALFNILFNYSARGHERRERGGIDLFNLCRTTHRDNYSPDIKNNNTVPTALMPTPNVNSNVGERNLPIEQANQKNMGIEMGVVCG